MLDQREVLGWLQDSVLVNSVELFGRNFDIVAAQAVGPRLCGLLDFARSGCGDLSQPEIRQIWQLLGFSVMQLKLLDRKEIVRVMPFGMGRTSLSKTGVNDAEGLILLEILQDPGQDF